MIPRLVLAWPRRSALVFAALPVLALMTSIAPTFAGGAVVPTEICDNCFDDDGNTFIDRDDPMCTAPANGALAGLGDESEAKAAIKCQKVIEKASTKFAVTKLGRLSKCVNQAFACIQRKNSDPACLPKATTACDKQVAAIATDETKPRTTLAKACDESQGASVSFANAVLPVTGLGYLAEEGGTPAVHPCAQSFASFTDVADCIVTRHECSIERILLSGPRGRERC